MTQELWSGPTQDSTSKNLHKRKKTRIFNNLYGVIFLRKRLYGRKKAIMFNYELCLTLCIMSGEINEALQHAKMFAHILHVPSAPTVHWILNEDLFDYKIVA